MVDLTERLRRHIIGRAYVGLLREGDALPSIREMARETGQDHRRIADAYRRLEAEGLVEVRRGAGVYLADDLRMHGPLLGDMANWLADVLAAGWARRLSVPSLGHLMERVASAPIRCVCVESVADYMVALSAELRTDFGFEVEEVALSGADPTMPTGPADVVVGTPFVAAAVKSVAAATGAPAITAPVNPDLARALVGILRTGPVTVVVSDPAYAQRMENYLAGGPHEGAATAVLASDFGSLEDVEVPAGGTVLATRAARRLLGEEEYHLIRSPPTFISDETAVDLARVRVRVATERGLLDEPGPRGAR